MYFNKKYTRSGSLFQGPYKSVRLNDDSQLETLIRYIHHGTNDYSSYPEYSEKRKTSWVRTITTHIEQGDVITEKEKELISNVVIEEDFGMLEGRNLAAKEVQVQKRSSRVPEIASAFAVFLVLTGLGLRNIQVSSAKNIASSPVEEPAVLSVSVSPTNTPEPKTMVLINAPQGDNSVKIRQEPANNAIVVFEAKDGDIFEFVSVNTGWLEVKLSEDLTGFVWAEETSLLEQTIN
jgi:hypothetical protein